MNVDAIVQRADSLGITLSIIGDRIRYSPKSRAPEDFIEALRASKGELLAYLSGASDLSIGAQRLLDRLRKGHLWLTETHLRLLEEREVYEGMEKRFLGAIDRWDELDAMLRDLYAYNGCVMGWRSRCPEDSPISCRGCARSQEPINPEGPKE